ncbi:TPA: MFS transporter [Citrobacter freundii]|uniref:MFS transporter n=1 Tax=Gammaproteobacteria TaxID=1236 RepID=UPI000791CEBB|nr:MULTISPECIES: MFS transporter [Gammaproteobacteria]MBN5418830.1 MFS transporter [Serratia marcescens]HBV8384417.1 MFS transporter [Citrobacter freundii]RQI36230.1 MFS transporter [Pseudomonas aeruginosa]SAF38013.1 major facilitator superfamily protein [Enterobacter hormaechei]HDY6068313.1 MFS transporter [Pseudomonas aeruginosa]
MPVVIYVFSLCTFTFGLSEFVVAGLVSSIAEDLTISVTAVGSSIAAYALGAAIGAPLLTALFATWRDRSVLLLTLGVLALGSLALAWADQLLPLNLIRFVIGLAHGVFMAVASNVAVKLVDPTRAGRALSVVWIGLTLSLALGVPVGTLLGSVWSWRVIFVALGVLGLFSFLGLRLLMPRQPVPTNETGLLVSLATILHGPLLWAASIAMLVSMATFSFFSYVAPFLLEVTHGGVRLLSLGMLVFGGCTILGNLVGGHAADRFEINRSLMVALTLLAGNLGLLYLFKHSPSAVLTLVGGLGVLFFAIVTLSTLRILRLSKQLAPGASSVASGLSIAAFNLGTALGGGLGGWLIDYLGLPYLPLGGVVVALFALVIMVAKAKPPSDALPQAAPSQDG